MDLVINPETIPYITIIVILFIVVTVQTVSFMFKKPKVRKSKLPFTVLLMIIGASIWLFMELISLTYQPNEFSIEDYNNYFNFARLLTVIKFIGECTFCYGTIMTILPMLNHSEISQNEKAFEEESIKEENIRENTFEYDSENPACPFCGMTTLYDKKNGKYYCKKCDRHYKF